MGRTNPTFRNLLDGITTRWQPYRRALRHGDQPHFDRLFEHALAHADAAGYLNPENPMEPILVSMLLEQEKRLADQDRQLTAHADRLAELEDELAARAERLTELAAEFDELERIVELEAQFDRSENASDAEDRSTPTEG